MDKITLAEKVIRQRERHSMNTTELSKLSGVPLTSLLDIEKGRRTNPGIETIEKISRALKISPAYFFEDAAVTPFDIKELREMLDEDLKAALLSEDFMPYLILGKLAYQERIPHEILQGIIDRIAGAIHHQEAKE